jgi:hypothetical protein
MVPRESTLTGRENTRRQVLATVGLAVTAGFAGCQGTDGSDGGDGSDGDDGSDDDEPSNAENDGGDGEPEPLDPPAGTSEEGIEDTTALVDATREALTENGYALEQELINTADGEQTLTVTQRRRSSLESERRLFVFDASSETNHIYIADGTQYVRSTAEEETTTRSREYQRDFAETHPPEMLDGGESLGGILRTGSFAPAETVTREGRRLLRFDLDSADESNVSGTVTEATGTVFVDADGVVHDASRYLEIEGDEQTVTIEQSFVITQLGEVTVARPDWVDEAAGAEN